MKDILRFLEQIDSWWTRRNKPKFEPELDKLLEAIHAYLKKEG